MIARLIVLTDLALGIIHLALLLLPYNLEIRINIG